MKLELVTEGPMAPRKRGFPWNLGSHRASRIRGFPWNLGGHRAPRKRGEPMEFKGLQSPRIRRTPWNLWGCSAPIIKCPRGDGCGVSQNSWDKEDPMEFRGSQSHGDGEGHRAPC